MIRGGFRSDLAAGCLLETVPAPAFLPVPPITTAAGLDEGEAEGGRTVVLESAAGKWGVVCVALEMAAQLTGVDAVLAVKSKPTGAAERDSREAEAEGLVGIDLMQDVGGGGGGMGDLLLDSDDDSD